MLRASLTVALHLRVGDGIGQSILSYVLFRTTLFFGYSIGEFGKWKPMLRMANVWLSNDNFKTVLENNMPEHNGGGFHLIFFILFTS